jgi:hypothetical protein
VASKAAASLSRVLTWKMLLEAAHVALRSVSFMSLAEFRIRFSMIIRRKKPQGKRSLNTTSLERANCIHRVAPSVEANMDPTTLPTTPRRVESMNPTPCNHMATTGGATTTRDVAMIACHQYRRTLS